MENPFRGWFAVGNDGAVSRLRTIGDVRDGRHPECPPRGEALTLAERCDHCGYPPLVKFWHGYHGELDLCLHAANRYTALMETDGWIVVIDHRQRTIDQWAAALRNGVA